MVPRDRAALNIVMGEADIPGLDHTSASDTNNKYITGDVRWGKISTSITKISKTNFRICIFPDSYIH